MGQYHMVYNKDKREYLHAHHMDMGLKLWEQIGFTASMSDALFLLVTNSNGRGGGDVPDHSCIGRWAGDSIVVQGDYAEEGDKGFISDAEIETYTDISGIANEMLATVFEGEH